MDIEDGPLVKKISPVKSSLHLQKSKLNSDEPDSKANPIKPKKNISGVTASTNFGSGVSAPDIENVSAVKPSMIRNGDNFEPRNSPEMKVQAMLKKNQKIIHGPNLGAKLINQIKKDKNDSSP